jgi:hypothetical protein
MRIGFLYMGDEEREIWGSAVTTLCLAEAFRALGHEVWRASATHTSKWDAFVEQPTDFVISEGVPHDKIPLDLWLKVPRIVFWYLSQRCYDADAILRTPFAAIATNSPILAERIAHGNVMTRYIELAASDSFATAAAKPAYASTCTYLGLYPHKSAEQMDLLFRPAAERGLAIWGQGWEDSPYAAWHRGILPFGDIGSLYKSAKVVLALTEARQKKLEMINNRLFEALACGAIVVSEQHAGLQRHELGQFVQFVGNQDEMRDFLAHLLSCDEFLDEQVARARAAQEIVLKRHTYGERAREFVTLFGSL